MPGYKDFVNAAVLGETDLDDYLMSQTVMRFASASARDTALSGILTEGLLAYLLDVNTITLYTGSAWVDVANIGAWTAYTPNASGWSTLATEAGAYQKIGRQVTARGAVVAGASTLFTTQLILELPFAAAATQWMYGGNLTDASSGVITPCAWGIGQGASIQLVPYAMSGDNQINNVGLTSTVPWTWADGDIVHWVITYEATS